MSPNNAHRRRAGANKTPASTNSSQGGYKAPAPTLPPRASGPRVLNHTTSHNSTTNDTRANNRGPNNTNNPRSLPAQITRRVGTPHMEALRSHTSTPPPPYTPGPYVQRQDDYTPSMSSLSLEDTELSSRSMSSPITASYEQIAYHEADYSVPDVDSHGPLHGQISSLMDYVITAMDAEQFDGDEKDLIILEDEHIPAQPVDQIRSRTRDVNMGRDRDRIRNRAVVQSPVGHVSSHRGQRSHKAKVPAYTAKYFAKTWLYANSRLQADLPPFYCQPQTYSLLSMAAHYSLRAYDHQTAAERPRSSGVSIAPSQATFKTQFIPANWRQGIKAMVLKIQVVHQCNTIVFAIRGSHSFMDWSVNLRHAPTSPTSFLDDPGNLVHSGFLRVARAMIAPVAAQLRQLLTDDPTRANASLLITGHSAGGAIASLLYSHMQSQSPEVASELKHLTSFFQRVDCITFGTPPLSLLPLQKPQTRALRSSIFLAFLNEGDPVVRADRGTVRSLLTLYASPSPSPDARPYWLMPPAQLSNAGHLVLLRNRAKVSNRTVYDERNNPHSHSYSGNHPRQPQRLGYSAHLRSEIVSTSTSVVPYSSRNTERDIEAVSATDQQLRNVVFGDLLMHPMKLYAARIERLRVQAGCGQIMIPVA